MTKCDACWYMTVPFPFTVGFQWFSNLTVTKLPFSEETVGGYLSSNCFSHDKEGNLTRKRVVLANGDQQKYFFDHPEDGNTVIKKEFSLYNMLCWLSSYKKLAKRIEL